MIVMNDKTIDEKLSEIEILDNQIEALLDLLQCVDYTTDPNSIKTVAEMCQTMMVEMMISVAGLGDSYKGKVTNEETK